MDAEPCTFSWLISGKNMASVATSEPKLMAYGHTFEPSRDRGDNASTTSHSELIRGKGNKVTCDDKKPRASRKHAFDSFQRRNRQKTCRRGQVLRRGTTPDMVPSGETSTASIGGGGEGMAGCEARVRTDMIEARVSVMNPVPTEPCRAVYYIAQAAAFSEIC